MPYSDFWSYPDLLVPLPNSNLGLDGLVAVGGDLTANRLLLAYRQGIFPWFQDVHQRPYWFSPDPRCVLFPEQLTVHKSMRSIFNQNKFSYTIDTCFEQVMRHCANDTRREDPQYHSSWISEDFVQNYHQLHQNGYAHSVEVWKDGDLVGGLYGISLGKVFYGESMFSLVPNASKAGFITLVQALTKHDFQLIDCQVETPHLMSLGATNISRQDFEEILKKNRYEATLKGQWRYDQHTKEILVT